MSTHSRDKENRVPRRRSASPPSRKTAQPTPIRYANLNDSINAPFGPQISDADLWAPFPPPPSPPPFITTLQGSPIRWRAETPEPQEDGNEEDELFPDPDDMFPGQDSVLVLPPPIQRPQTPPPPYEAGSQVPQQAPVAQAAPQVQPRWPGLGSLAPNDPARRQLKFNVPLTSNIIGQTPVNGTVSISTGADFNTGLQQLCQRMGVPLSTSLAYKWSGARVRDPPITLTSSADWNDMVREALLKILRARTREVVIMIHNMDAPTDAPSASATSSRTQTVKPGKADKPVESLAVEQLKALKMRYECSKHSGRYCFVRPDGSHLDLTVQLISLWAKEWALNKDNADLEHPPNHIVFQDCFLSASHGRRQKKPSLQEANTTPPSMMPTIINNHFYGDTSSSTMGPVPGESSFVTTPVFDGNVSTPSSSSSFPLDKKTGANRVNTESEYNASGADFDFTALGEVDDPLAFLLATSGPTLTYTSTRAVLEGLWTAFPYFSIDAIDQLLTSWGAPYINGLLIFPEVTLVDIGVPPSIVQPLLERARFLAAEAESRYEAQKGIKGKGKM
ncbi:hypothetical protein BDZ89DRAFT_1145892 [Hymenopellis radicata]|nr:hypothetical protein BDZ89DRAFT_1145892 [Hymenopellis radicata]